MYIKNSSTKKVRNRNWSYGGMAILDAIETGKFGGSNKSFYKTHLHPNKKLYFLKVKFPHNTFYESLFAQSQKYKLSAKQLNCIDRDYEKHFSQQQKQAHLNVAGRRNRKH